MEDEKKKSLRLHEAAMFTELFFFYDIRTSARDDEAVPRTVDYFRRRVGE